MTMLRFIFAMTGIGLAGAGVSALPTDSLVGTLTLSKALDFALSHSPEVAAGRYEVKLREGDALQARLPSNPELEAEAENLAARGALTEDDQTITIRLRQTVDLSRFPRASGAVRGKELAQLDLEAIQRRVRARVRQQFVSLLAAQERIALAADLNRLAGAAHGVAVEKVRSGKAPPTDSLQSWVALSMALIDSGKAADELALARRGLASACGAPKPSFDSAEGRLGPVTPVPDWETLAGKWVASPEWRRGNLEGTVLEAGIQAEKTARLPPITLEGGLRTLPERDGRAYVAGVSLPLPIWNWNQGAIRSAKARKAKAGEEGRVQRLEFIEKLAALHSQAVSSHREATLLDRQVLPAATATFEGVQEAYRVGKFASLDALNAQKALFEARSHYLDALTLHHQAVAGLEEMLGDASPSSEVNPKP